MSEYEFHSGKIRKIDVKSDNFKDAIDELKVEYLIDYIDYEYEYFESIHLFKYKNEYFEIIETCYENLSDNYGKVHKSLPNGDIEFTVAFKDSRICINDVLTDILNEYR